MSFVAPRRINPSFFGEATERKRGELMLKRTFFHIELGTAFEKQFVLLKKSHLNPEVNRERITQIVFKEV